ncbi:MAG: lactonase family protein [Dysgonamonadaceae bacterium]|jgi:6-phosphogluconolactonase (cycloisomerase 2 family)|nr:lactonase family protein [Dysgonamonadaceae bacterium]
MYLIIGSYSDGSTPGISVYDFDMDRGEFSFVNDIKNVQNPSYLAISSDEKLIYSVNENDEGAVSVFSFEKGSGALHFINSQLTKGAHPCYIAVDKGRNFIVTANYTGGSVSYFPLNAEGHIRPLQQLWDMNELMRGNNNEAVSHIHTTVFSPCGKYLFVTDLGLNKIYRFNVETDNSLTFDEENVKNLPPGSGPRHLAFHPNGNFLYCINEHAGAVAVFSYRNGVLTLVQTIDTYINPDVRRKGSADIHLTPDGRFLYASNRLQDDGIAIFSVCPERGTLTKEGYQKTGIHPRNFIISPNGKFLLCANRNSNNIQIFEINQRTGLLCNTGKEIQLSQPVCLKWIGR